jgi:hypothetical protein
MTKAGKPTISVPQHPTVKRATLAGILDAAGVTEAQYLRAFNPKSKAAKSAKKRAAKATRGVTPSK